MKIEENAEMVRVNVPTIGVVEYGQEGGFAQAMLSFQDDRKLVNERYLVWLEGLSEAEKERRGMGGRFWYPVGCFSGMVGGSV